MGNKQGKALIELLVILVVMVITSSVVLILVNAGVISVKAEHEPVSVLNAEFIPVGRAGHLAVKEFSFCETIDDNYICINEKNRFTFNDEVYFKFILETSTFDGEVLVIKNYRLRSPSGELLIDVDAKDNFFFELKSSKQTELITFKDFFIILNDGETGEYTLELVLENPLIDKRTTLVKKFEVVV